MESESRSGGEGRGGEEGVEEEGRGRGGERMGLRKRDEESSGKVGFGLRDGMDEGGGE